MPFNSFSFWLVFPFIFGLYWLIPARYARWRKVFLLVAGYLLYLNWKPAFALVLLGVTGITFAGGLLLEKQEQPARRRRLAWLFALLGLLPLLVFKYYNFLNDSLSACMEVAGLHFALPGLNWAVPVGISFYTFVAVGYMLDVYHGRVKAERDLLDYALFVSFFPAVTSGPISTAEELMPQIKAVHHFDGVQARQGLKLLLWGMFLKVFVADRLGLFVDGVFANFVHYDGATCFLASVFYTVQIYGDFAGYSLMAVGIAKTLGFDLVDNFRRPYLAVSVTDFWRRWHISLTRWLTRQVYIPLGGNRCSRARNCLNILVTFLVSGLWHGAHWTFVVWGVLHGLLLIMERTLGWRKYEGGNLAVRWARIGITFLAVNFAWVFFRMPDLADAFAMIGRMFSGWQGVEMSAFGSTTNMVLSLIGILILAFKDIRDEFLPVRFAWLRKPVVRWSVYVALFTLILAFGVLDSGQFIYVNF